MIGDFGLKKQGSSMLASFLLQIWTIRLGLGCVNSTSWLLQAKGREVTHSKNPLCTYYLSDQIQFLPILEKTISEQKRNLHFNKQRP